MNRQFAPSTVEEYEDNVRALWSLPHREERYLALSYARAHRRFVTPARTPLYLRLVREGAWWDLVDEVAVHLIGALLLRERDDMRPRVAGLFTDDDVWLRRTSLLMHNQHRRQTDAEALFATALALAPETSFWIRKAIGWALREYAAAEPERVRSFLVAHQRALSGLSLREASRPLVKRGLWP
jgi:3-methyladenine DNA glycosylase AlkD